MSNKKQIKKFCEEFAGYVTGNWRNNHLYITIYPKDPEGVTCSCHGLGKVNWSGTIDDEYPFCQSLQAVLDTLPENAEVVDIAFFCGNLMNVKLNNREYNICR